MWQKVKKKERKKWQTSEKKSLKKVNKSHKLVKKEWQ